MCYGCSSYYVIGRCDNSWRFFFAMKQKCIWWTFYSWMRRSRSQQWSNYYFSISQHKRGYDYWIERIWEVRFWAGLYGLYRIENTNLSCIQVCWVERICCSSNGNFDGKIFMKLHVRFIQVQLFIKQNWYDVMNRFISRNICYCSTMNNQVAMIFWIGYVENLLPGMRGVRTILVMVINWLHTIKDLSTRMISILSYRWYSGSIIL